MPRLRNRKHEAFAREIAAMTPYDRAYRTAGYVGAPRWHRYNANKLAHRPEVKARIDELRAEFDRMAGIHAEYIKRQLLPLIEANAQDLYETDVDGKSRLRAVSDIPRDLAAAISKIKVDSETGAVVEITLASKTEAGNTLLRAIPGGLAPERHELTVDLVERLGEMTSAELAELERKLSDGTPNG